MGFSQEPHKFLCLDVFRTTGVDIFPQLKPDAKPQHGPLRFATRRERVPRYKLLSLSTPWGIAVVRRIKARGKSLAVLCI
jgi:hypothetical protein